MATVTIDGRHISGEPIFVIGIYEMAIHLIHEMIEQGTERSTLPFVYKADGRRAGTLIYLRRDSTLAIDVEDDGSDAAALLYARADTGMSELIEACKATASRHDAN